VTCAFTLTTHDKHPVYRSPRTHI